MPTANFGVLKADGSGARGAHVVSTLVPYRLQAAGHRNIIAMRAAPLRVLVVGALTRTGQQVVRSLAARRDDFSVTALCGREMGGSARSDASSPAQR